MRILSVAGRSVIAKAVVPILVLAGVSVQAETYTWKGGTGSFAEAANWTTSDNGQAVPSGGSINLVFPSGSSTVTDVGSLTVDTMVLGGAVELQYGSSGGSFVVNGVISGSGSLKSTGKRGGRL